MQAMPPLSVKGKADNLQAYLVLRAKPRAVALQLRGVEGVETEMIGRELELKRLQSLLQSVIEDQELEVCTILGEAGLGKTRLLREFQQWVDLLPQSVRLFCGRATAEIPGLPFALMRNVFGLRFEILESDSPVVAREKFGTGVIGLLKASAEASVASDDELRLEAHFIGQLLGLDFSQSPWLRDLRQNAEQVRHRAFHYLTRFFTAVCRGATVSDGAARPVSATLLVVEDAHWSDNGSLDLIDHLARTCRDAAWMIMCLARPNLHERRPVWGKGCRRTHG